MRLWSLHPHYLDAKGLVACWRESLLAQKVLAGETAGYRSHPQLIRFRACNDPSTVIGAYLSALGREADTRGYQFNADLIARPPDTHDGDRPAPLTVTTGQLTYEWSHLLAKLRVRAPEVWAHLYTNTDTPRPHPLFAVVEGDVESWEFRAVGTPQNS